MTLLVIEDMRPLSAFLERLRLERLTTAMTRPGKSPRASLPASRTPDVSDVLTANTAERLAIMVRAVVGARLLSAGRHGG
jgi:hypothetical protein